MRVSALFGVIAVLAAVPASAQSSTSHTYGLDPYKPTDAAVLRNYGTVLVTNTPLLELSALDPYNPTQAELLRSLGGGIPCCALWGWGPTFGPLTPDSHRGDRFMAAPPVVVMMPASAPVASTSGTAPTVSGPLTTAIRPNTNDGISMSYGGRTYVSGGRAIAFDNSQFQQVGGSASAPIYQRRGATDGVIYVRAREGMVAPYRPKP